VEIEDQTPTIMDHQMKEIMEDLQIFKHLIEMEGTMKIMEEILEIKRTQEEETKQIMDLWEVHHGDKIRGIQGISQQIQEETIKIMKDIHQINLGEEIRTISDLHQISNGVSVAIKEDQIISQIKEEATKVIKDLLVINKINKEEEIKVCNTLEIQTRQYSQQNRLLMEVTQIQTSIIQVSWEIKEDQEEMGEEVTEIMVEMVEEITGITEIMVEMEVLEELEEVVDLEEVGEEIVHSQEIQVVIPEEMEETEEQEDLEAILANQEIQVEMMIENFFILIDNL
jgi:hypothetical protein